MTSLAIAQTSKTTKTPPASVNQADMDKAMKQLQDVMKDLPPEAKQMMDSLGINEKLSKSTKDLKAKGITDKQIQEAVDDDNRIMPKKNPSLIAKANIRLKNEVELKSFIKFCCNSSQIMLGDTTMNDIQQIMSEFRMKPNGNQSGYADIASILLLASKDKLAFAAFTKEFQANEPIDYTDLNNFAALFNMTGRVEYSLPILNYINKKFPDNAIVLNNIGQAWFTCGEKDSAKMYFLACTRIMPDNPEANQGLAAIYTVEGDPVKANQAIKASIKKAYSAEKEETAKKMGIKLTEDDFSMPPQTAYDPLGFSKIERPVFQKNLADYKLFYATYTNWEAAVAAKIDELEKEATDLNAEMGEEIKDKNSDVLASIKSDNTSNLANAVGSVANLYCTPLTLKILSYTHQFDQEFFANKVIKFGVYQNDLQHDYDSAVDGIKKICGKIEGTKYCKDPKAECRLSSINPLAIDKLEKEINAYTKMVSENLYYDYYAYKGKYFRVIELGYEIDFLKLLSSYSHPVESGECSMMPKDQTIPKSHIGNFEETHCPYEPMKFSDLTGMAKVTMTCTTREFELDLPVFRKKTLEDNNGNFIKGSYWAGLTLGKSMDDGILKFGLKASAGVFWEVDNKKGITDWGVEQSLEGKMELNYKELNGKGKDNKTALEGVGTDYDNNVKHAYNVKDPNSGIVIYVGGKPPLSNPEIKVGFVTRIGVNSGVTSSVKGSIWGNEVKADQELWKPGR